MKQTGQDRGTLLLALIAGLSINGSFAALFSSVVPFSIFPIIALVLTVYCLHQRYQNRTMPLGLPGLAALGLDPARHQAVAEAALTSSSMRGNPVTPGIGDLVVALSAAS